MTSAAREMGVFLFFFSSSRHPKPPWLNFQRFLAWPPAWVCSFVFVPHGLYPLRGFLVLASRVSRDKSSFSSWLVFHLELSLAFAVLAMKWELGNLLMRLYLDSQDEPICGYEEGRVVKAFCHIPDGLRRWILSSRQWFFNSLCSTRNIHTPLTWNPPPPALTQRLD